MTGNVPSSLAFATTALVTSLLLALGACADAEPDRMPPVLVDGGVSLPPEDGGESPIEDGGADVVDAGERICSDDDFCHSAVPAGRDLAAVWGDGHGVVWAGAADGAVLRWDGSAWKQHAAIAPGVTSIWGSGPTDLWIATKEGLVHGEGASPTTLVFTPVDLPGDPTAPIETVWGTGPEDIWAVGGETPTTFPPLPAKGRVLHFTRGADGGAGWTVDDEVSSMTVDYRGVFGSPATGVWLFGNHAAPFTEPRGVLLRRRPSATSWEEVHLPADPKGDAPARSLLVGGLSSDVSVWFAGYTLAGTEALWHGTSTDGGGTFTWTFSARDFWERPIAAFWGVSANETWAVGGTGLVSRWDGASWRQASIRISSVPVGRPFRGIWGSAADDFWVVGDQIALHRTNAGKP